MEYIIVAITVIFGAGLTFFSGFGLGTLMLPVFSLYFDVTVAVGATAIVHMANNIFKFALVSKYIHYQTLLRFGIPAVVFAALGGLLLGIISDVPVVYTYSFFGHQHEVTYIKMVIGLLMIFFAWFDLDPRFNNLMISEKHLPFGGILSGFFGGVSGHQGAFRATFLTKANITKEQFIGTSNAVSLGVDTARLIMYLFVASTISNSSNKFTVALTDGKMLLLIGIICAFLGTFIGKRLVAKTTIVGIQRTVGVLLFLIGSLMATGIL
jgi:uncharacterized membrane protein YfcA